MNLKLEWINNVKGLDRLIPLKKLDEIESGDKEVTPEKVARQIGSYWMEGAHFVVANVDSLDVGYGIGMIRHGNTSYLINKIYVLPDFRRRGIGTEIERAQKEYAFSLGIPQLVSRVNIDNLASLRVQQKMGAKKLCSYPGAILFTIPII